MSLPPVCGHPRGRVLVTRARHQAGKLSEGLRALGYEPVEVPVLEIQPPASFEALDTALRQLHSYDWLILTSANTVRALADRAALLGISLAPSPVQSLIEVEPSQPPRLSSSVGEPTTCSGAELRSGLEDGGVHAGPQVAAVGVATAEAARRAGFQITLVPESYLAESLLTSILGGANPSVSGQRILLARAAIARDVLPDALREAGAEVDVVDAYRNIVPEIAPELLRQALQDGLDAATFTSSSSATHLQEAAHAAGVEWPFAGVPAISIGPITSQTLRELGWEAALEANPSDIPGLIAAVEQVLHGSR